MNNMETGELVKDLIKLRESRLLESDKPKKKHQTKQERRKMMFAIWKSHGGSWK